MAVHAFSNVIAQFARADMVAEAVPDDPRIWVPQEPNVWFRPLILNVTQGGWTTVLRVGKTGVLTRHRHPEPVYGYVIKGSWHYLEHDWVARAGMFVFEPPGETHTLTVDGEDEEMMTLFQVNGSMIYMDEANQVIGFDDVFSKIERARQHYMNVGLGEDFVEQFIR